MLIVTAILMVGCAALSVWGMQDIWNAEYDGTQPDW